MIVPRTVDNSVDLDALRVSFPHDENFVAPASGLAPAMRGTRSASGAGHSHLVAAHSPPRMATNPMIVGMFESVQIR